MVLFGTTSFFILKEDFVINTITIRRKKLLNDLGIYNYEDLLNYFPYKYINYECSNITSDSNGKRVVINGIILEKSKLIYIKNNLKKFTLSVKYNNNIFKVIIFNREYLYDVLKVNDKVLLSGKLKYKKLEISLYEIFYYNIENIKIVPLYHLNDNISSYEFNKLVSIAYENVNNHFFDENIPSYFIDKYKLIDRKKAYHYIHFPSNNNELKSALRYFKYSELLKFSINMELNHVKMRKQKTNLRHIDRNNLNKILNENKITLTNDQIKVSKEIFNDIESNKNMYRLLIGDVGCGKTIVSALALASICKNNFQGVLLCPTDILARQHYDFFKNFLKDYRICLLVSNLKNKDIIKENIRNHQYDIIIGTTAMLEDDVIFNNLGIVVIDEQHRFGVKQRSKIIDKGKNVDVLYMSATPIPRSLALSLYGELDISTIKELPFIKRNVVSYAMVVNKIDKLIPRIDSFLKHKEKIFIVCSLIDGESDKQSAVTIYNDLMKIYKSEVKLIHGKLKDSEKNKIIESFKNDEFHILVSTTVIEVGIDIKDASVMIIFNANCFGLATLHQLRGRVGRNGKKGYCYFLCNHKNELTRLKFLKENNDGFKISEYDLRYRGMGELDGFKQSGLRNFIFCDLKNDVNILEIAREDAKIILKYQKNSKEYRNYVTKL